MNLQFILNAHKGKIIHTTHTTVRKWILGTYINPKELITTAADDILYFLGGIFQQK